MQPHKVPDYLVPAHSLHLPPVHGDGEVGEGRAGADRQAAPAARGPGGRPGEGQVNVLQKAADRAVTLAMNTTSAKVAPPVTEAAGVSRNAG